MSRLEFKQRYTSVLILVLLSCTPKEKEYVPDPIMGAHWTHVFKEIEKENKKAKKTPKKECLFEFRHGERVVTSVMVPCRLMPGGGK